MAFDYVGQLFSGAEQGDVWLADSGDHYQEVARSTLAGNGDPVGSMTGQAGNWNFEQSTASLQFTLTQDAGGKWYMASFNDHMSTGTTSDFNYLHESANDAYICMAVRLTSDLNVWDTFFGNHGIGSGNKGFSVGHENSSYPNGMAVYLMGSSGFTFSNVQPAALETQQDFLLEVIKQGQTFSVYIDGCRRYTRTHSTTITGASHSPFTLFNSFGSGSTAMTGWLYGFLATNTLPSAAQQAGIQTDMLDRMVSPPTGVVFPPVIGVHTASVTLTGFPASESGINVTVRVDGESAPFYYATGQSANGSGELAIAATNCPLDTGTRTVLITCDNTDGTAGGVSNNHRAFHDYVEVTVS